MKVGITGHTSGLGKALTELFPDYVGFSRSNGFDILKREDRARILSRVADCDIFINNAYADFAQVDLLSELWDQWKMLDRRIVCISSRAADNIFTKYPWYRYSIHKAALDDACSYMAFQGLLCKVTNVKPGYIDTPGVAGKTGNKMDPKELASFIKYIIDTPKTMWVPTITIFPN